MFTSIFLSERSAHLPVGVTRVLAKYRLGVVVVVLEVLRVVLVVPVVPDAGLVGQRQRKRQQ